MLVLGLTGSIATGKTTCSSLMAKQDAVAVINADAVAHELMEPGNTTYYSILSSFVEPGNPQSLEPFLGAAVVDAKPAQCCPHNILNGLRDQWPISLLPFDETATLYRTKVAPLIPKQITSAACNATSYLCPSVIFKCLPEVCNPFKARPINRKTLGDVVFSDKSAKAKINAATHPFIRVAMLRRLVGAFLHGAKICVYDTPLLFEVGMDRFMFAGTIVVYAPKDIQIKRLMNRDGLTREQALARISAQMDIEEKKKKATFIIDNSGAEEATVKQVKKLVGGQIQASIAPFKLAIVNSIPFYVIFFLPALALYLFLFTFEHMQHMYTRLKFFYAIHDFSKFYSYFSFCKGSSKGKTLTKSKSGKHVDKTKAE